MPKSGKAIRVELATLTSTGTAFNNMSAESLANLAKVNTAFSGAGAAVGEPALATALEQMWTSWSRELHLTSQVLSEIGTKLGGSAATYGQADTGTAKQMTAVDPGTISDPPVVVDPTPSVTDPATGDGTTPPVTDPATGDGTTPPGTDPTTGDSTSPPVTDPATGDGTTPPATDPTTGGDPNGTITAPTTGGDTTGTTTTSTPGDGTTGSGAAPTPAGDANGGGTSTATGDGTSGTGQPPSAGGDSSGTNSVLTNDPANGTSPAPVVAPASAPPDATAPINAHLDTSSGLSPVTQVSPSFPSTLGDGVQQVGATVPLSAVTTAFDVSPSVPSTGAGTSSNAIVDGAIATGAGIALLAAAMSPSWRKRKMAHQRRDEVPSR